MTVYLDSSSLVKLYVAEADSATIVALVEKAAIVATSVIAYPEVRSALARKRRERSLTTSELARACEQFDTDWLSILALVLTHSLARRAGELTSLHGLRGADAIHLASFERLLASAGDDDVHFSSADHQLGRAALRLG
jgi:predicted nucleic acid-binding protein